jgi:hypothetical protein
MKKCMYFVLEYAFARAYSAGGGAYSTMGAGWAAVTSAPLGVEGATVVGDVDAGALTVTGAVCASNVRAKKLAIKITKSKGRRQRRFVIAESEYSLRRTIIAERRVKMDIKIETETTADC